MNWLSLTGLDRMLARWKRTQREVTVATENRLALARIEWKEALHDIRCVLGLAIATCALSVVSLMTLTAAVMIQFWESPYRQTAAWSLACFWVVAFAVALVFLLRYLRRSAQAFAMTREELAEDWRCIKEKL